MEKVYHEMEAKDHDKPVSPYVMVRAYIPKGDDEYDLPAIIILEDGTVSDLGARHPEHTEYTTMKWNHKASEVIREAICLFDLLRLKVWEKVDGE